MLDGNTLKLKAIVVPCSRGFDAQLLEIDIAARGDTIADLLMQIAYAIELNHTIAAELKEVPFARRTKVPECFSTAWDSSVAPSSHRIDIPQTVVLALADSLLRDRAGSGLIGIELLFQTVPFSKIRVLQNTSPQSNICP